MKLSLLPNLGQTKLPNRGRETFSSLRACRGAIRIARDVLFGRPIDVVHVNCKTCGARVNCSTISGAAQGLCPRCKSVVDVPGYVRGRVEWDGNQPDGPAQAEQPRPATPYVRPPLTRRGIACLVLGVIVTGFLVMLCIALSR